MKVAVLVFFLGQGKSGKGCWDIGQAIVRGYLSEMFHPQGTSANKRSLQPPGHFLSGSSVCGFKLLLFKFLFYFILLQISAVQLQFLFFCKGFGLCTKQIHTSSDIQTTDKTRNRAKMSLLCK